MDPVDFADFADLVLRDAEVVDGTGAPSYRADVAVKDGRIVSIVKEAAAAGCQRPRARREMDVEGLVLAPGFIDMHAHSDLAVLRDPDHCAKVAQGVTLDRCRAARVGCGRLGRTRQRGLGAGCRGVLCGGP